MCQLIVNISAVPILIQKAKEDFAAEASLAPKGRGENILFLSPDIGGKRRTGISGIKKERLTSFEVKMVSPKLNFKGKVIGAKESNVDITKLILKNLSKI